MGSTHEVKPKSVPPDSQGQLFSTAPTDSSTGLRTARSTGASEQVYVYAWGNNERRAQLKGRRCVIEARGRMYTVLIRFLDTGEKVTTSLRALREIA